MMSDEDPNGKDQGEEKPKSGPRSFPVLKQKPTGNKQLRRPPPKLQRTKGQAGDKLDLRAAALQMHMNMRDMWNPSPANSGPKITKILQEEIEGEALAVALEMIDSSISMAKIELVRQVVQEIASGGALEFKTETEGEHALCSVDASVLKDLVVAELTRRLAGLDGDSSPPPSPPDFPFKYTIVASTDKGLRPENEDEYVVLEHFNELLGLSEDEHPRQIFFGLYDGHSGRQAADYCRTHLHVNVAREHAFHADPDRALLNAFLKTDTLFNKKAEFDGVNDGTTALVALLRRDCLIVANCGDAKGFLCKRGGSSSSSPSSSSSSEMVIVPVCTVQHPDREDEKERVKSAGGAVVWFGTWRVNGVLAVSRSIGDKALKDIVIAVPEIQTSPLTEGEDEFFILATDGLWDVMDEKQVANFVREVARTKGRDQVSRALIDEAVNVRGSKDNVTVVVVFLDWGASLLSSSSSSSASFSRGDDDATAAE